VIVHTVHADADDLAVALVELRLEARNRTKLGGANRREVLRLFLS
jgi:hypothetical protein